MRTNPFPIAAAILSIALAGLAAQEAGDTGDSPDLPLKPGRTLSLDTDEGSWISVDGQSGRRDHRLRPARRPLHHPVRRRRRDAAHRGDGLRQPAALQPGRIGGAVRLGPRRRGEPVADRRRIEGDPASDERVGQQLRVARMAARWRLRGGGGRGGRAGRRRPAQPEALDVARRRRHRGAAHQGAGITPDHGSGPGARRAAHLVRAAGAAVAVQRHLPAVPARGVRPGDRRAVRADVTLRLGPAPDHLSRPARGSFTARGTRTRPGCGCGSSPRERSAGLRIRSSGTTRNRWRGADTLPGMSFTPDSSEVVVSYGGKIWRVPLAEGAAPVPVPFRVRVDLEIGPELAFKYPVDDSRRFTVRQIRDAVPSPDGMTLAFAALDRLYVRPLAGGRAATPDRAGHGGGAASVVARRRVGRLRHLVGGRWPRVQGARRRQRRAGEVDHPPGHLPVPGVVPGRRAARRHPGARPQLPGGGPADRPGSQREHRGDPGRRRRLDAGGADRRADLSPHDDRSGPHLPLPPRGRPGFPPLGRNGREGAREGERTGAAGRRRARPGLAGADGARGRSGAGAGPPGSLRAGGALRRGRDAGGVRRQPGARQRAGPQADGGGRAVSGVERGRAAGAVVDRQRTLHLRPRRRGSGRRGGARGRGGGRGPTRMGATSRGVGTRPAEEARTVGTIRTSRTTRRTRTRTRTLPSTSPARFASRSRRSATSRPATPCCAARA